MQFLPDSQSLCVVFRNGDIFQVNTSNNNTTTTTPIGSIDSGILAMSWSPDYELVIFITANYKILQMTQMFDVMSESPVFTSESGEQVSYNVGWGKKETQFHGSMGKEAAKQRVDLNNVSISPDDDFLPRVSWRGDGNYFVVSAVDNTENNSINKRTHRVYNRDAILQNTSEPVPMLEHPLCWRPSGNLITSSQRLPHRHDIVFFERNGLRHGEFTLREKDFQVVDLAWNSDSSMLAILLRNPNNNNVMTLQIWTMSNYHYFLQQSFDEAVINAFEWDPETPTTLYMISDNSRYHRISLNSRIYRSCENFDTTTNSATVAVIDGDKVNLTPFKFMNVPPPFSAYSIQLADQEQVCDLSFGTMNNNNNNNNSNLAVLGGNGTVNIYTSSNVKKAPTLCKSFNLTKQFPHIQPRQIIFPFPELVMTLGLDKKTNRDVIIVSQISDTTTTTSSSSSHNCPTHHNQRIYHNANTSEILIVSLEGEVHTITGFGINNDGQPQLQIEPYDTCPLLPTPTPEIYTSPKKTLISFHERSNKLFENENLIARSVTSVSLNADFLLYTTHSHQLHFIPWFSDDKTPIRITESITRENQYTRRVERSSKLVTHVPGSVEVVLQHSRGNLETIRPRALVIHVVKSLIRENNWADAVYLCRKDRLDLNFLVDVNTDWFLQNVSKFTRAVINLLNGKGESVLEVFLSTLRNEDTTIQLYPAITSDLTMAVELKPISEFFKTKVNTVCDAVRSSLLEIDPKCTTFYKSILTTYVKKEPQELETAMRLVKTLRVDHGAAIAESAIKFILFLTRSNYLFEVALGMYDFALVIMVAQLSQKDPREYLPFLTELQKLEKYYQRFKIDDHLRRHERALENLALAGEAHWDECCKYMERHGLYQAGLRIFKDSESKYKVVLSLYAAELASRYNQSEAAALYVLAGKDEEALEAFINAGEWSGAMECCDRLGYSNEQVADYARQVAEVCVENRDFLGAARCLLEYAGCDDNNNDDITEAVALFCKASEWSEAKRVVSKHKQPQLIDTIIRPALLKSVTLVGDDMSESMKQIERIVSRLVKVRATKEAEIAGLLNPLAGNTGDYFGDNDAALDNIDMMSDTTSMMTRSTAFTGSLISASTSKTGRTSKNKRKEARKKLKGKEGSIYEEDHLVDQFSKIIEKSNTLRKDVMNLTKALTSLNMFDAAKGLQVKLLELIAMIKRNTGKIYNFVKPETMDDIKNRLVSGEAGIGMAIEVALAFNSLSIQHAKMSDLDFAMSML